ncbi:hypothetical protein LPJ61_003806, partial [Coemansia biformis]
RRLLHRQGEPGRVGREEEGAPAQIRRGPAGGLRARQRVDLLELQDRERRRVELHQARASRHNTQPADRAQLWRMPSM